MTEELVTCGGCGARFNEAGFKAHVCHGPVTRGVPDQRHTDWSKQWSYLYTNRGGPSPYPDDGTTYMRAGSYLSGPGLVEEWGCATTWGARFVGAPYQGVDGADGVEKWGAIQHDLRTYRSQVPKILLRHVLEHNYEWRDILMNLMDSFTDRAVVVFFIPPNEGEDVNTGLHWDDGPDAPPALAVCRKDLETILSRHGTHWIREDCLNVECPPYNHEVMYFLRKKGKP